MASTRSASPASGVGSPEPLTPRSKIRALLAAVDSSEDEDTGDKQSRPIRRVSPQARRAALQIAINSQHTDASDDESDVEIRPRGRLAARMHGAAPSVRRTSVETESNDRTALSDKEEEKSQDAAMEDVDDDDDLPALTSRLQRRALRESTPEDSTTEARSHSPGLFVSSPIRPSPVKTAEQRSDSEDELPAIKSDRFRALVERKKQERLAREAVEEARKAERWAQQEKLASELDQLASDDGNLSDTTDDEGGRKLTQGARPARKASKKAIEEINRETQRMARSMQLAHEAKTRKKISKSSLFERFNFRPAGMPEPKTTSSSRPGTPMSDVDMKDADTPPSSPPVVDEKQTAGVNQTVSTADTDNDEELPTIDQLVASQPPTLDKGKGKEIVTEDTTKSTTKPKRQVRVKFPSPAVNVVTIDSDDELEITRTEKNKIKAIFDHVPEKTVQESHSLKALRALAQVKSPGKGKQRKNDHSRMTTGELQFYLQQKARQQAKLERDRRLNMLKAQGVVVQTAEERERQMQEVEDIVSKAREEAEQIMQQERAAAKKDNGDKENDPLAWDDSDDEEYEDPANEADAEASAIELSGSEDEEEEDDGSGEEAGGAMFDDAAEDGESEASEELEEKGDEKDNTEDEDELPTNHKRRSRKHVAILSDDDEVDIEATPKPKSTTRSTSVPSIDTPGSVLRSAKKSFIPGLPVQGPAGLGLTQIFAGTMDDSQMSPVTGPTQSMMPDFDNFPDSNFSTTMDEPAGSPMAATENDDTQATTQGVQLNLSQTQAHGLDSLMRDVPNTQYSDIIEASQDGGFQEHTPLKDRFVDRLQSTVDTVVLGQEDAAQHGSPLIRRGRLRRKMDVSMTGDDLVPAAVEATPASQTAFNVLKDGAEKEKKKRAMEDFNRKKSKAKEMVEEHAEESEDEYQGLGGYDGEDSDDESTASVKDMIDDAAGNDADERKLAAFYA